MKLNEKHPYFVGHFRFVGPVEDRSRGGATVVILPNGAVGVSLCSPEDAFNRKLGRTIAAGRARAKPVAFVDGRVEEWGADGLRIALSHHAARAAGAHEADPKFRWGGVSGIMPRFSARGVRRLQDAGLEPEGFIVRLVAPRTAGEAPAEDGAPRRDPP